MKLIYFLFFTLTFSICSADSNYLLIPDERFIPCDGTDIGRNPLDLQGLTIDLDFILLDNNKIMLNGTCTFKTTVEAPWNILINGEKLERGQWTQRIVKNMKDACNDLFNPMDVFYSNMNTFQRCPMEKGDKWMANELNMNSSFLTFPPMYLGKWRVKIFSKYIIDGVKVTDCAMIYVDIDAAT